MCTWNGMNTLAMVTVWAGFILGGVSMVIYYRCYHPNHLYLKQCGMVSSEDNTHGANQPRLLYPVDINVKVVDEVQLQNDVAYKEAVGKQTDTNIHNVMMPKGGRDYHGNQSELTSLQSFHLGLSVFTDDLVDHFDNAQLALFDDSVAVKESVSNLRTRSVTNSPLLLKDRLVRKTRSVANSPVLYTCKSDQSYDTSLEPLPNISLGSPPKSTDAEEVRKIYDAILGVCKSKPVSARKLFQSGESLDGSHTSVCKKGSPVPTYDHLARQDKRYYHLDYTAKWNSYRSDESANQSHFNLSSLSKPDVLPSTSHHQPLKMNQMQEVKASQNTTNQNHAVKLPIHQDKSANQNQVIKGSLYKPTNQNQVVKGVLYKPANQIHFVKGVQDKPDYYTQKTRISEKQADKKQRRNYSDKQTSVA
uniref:Uncharacterized protein LOC102800699 n=1 Tax=Saccoglossus kowalevskii TaxID=10224 RepID=A0ABM0M4W4_SACKO